MTSRHLSSVVKSIVLQHRTDAKALANPVIWRDLTAALTSSLNFEIHLEPLQLFNIITDVITTTLQRPEQSNGTSGHGVNVAYTQTMVAIIDSLQILFSSLYESSFAPSPSQLFDHITKIYEILIDNFPSFFGLLTQSYVYMDYLQLLWDAWRLKQHQWSQNKTKHLFDSFLSKIVRQHGHFITLVSSLIPLNTRPLPCSTSPIPALNTSFIQTLQHEQGIYGLLDGAQSAFSASISPIMTSTSSLSTLRSPLQQGLLQSLDVAQQQAFATLYQRFYHHLISTQHTTTAVNPFLLSYLTTISSSSSQTAPTTTPESLRLFLSSICFLHASFSSIIVNFIITGETIDLLIQELTIFFSSTILSSLDSSAKQPHVPELGSDVSSALVKFSQGAAKFCTPPVFSQLCPLLYVETLPVVDTTLDLLALPLPCRQKVIEQGARVMKERRGKNENFEMKSEKGDKNEKSEKFTHSYITYCLNEAKRSSSFDLITTFLSASYGTIKTPKSTDAAPQFDFQSITDHVLLYKLDKNEKDEKMEKSQKMDEKMSQIPLHSTFPLISDSTPLPKPSSIIPVEIAMQYIPFWFDILLAAVRLFYKKRAFLLENVTTNNSSSFTDSEMATTVESIARQITRDTNQHQWMIETTLSIILMKILTSATPIKNVTNYHFNAHSSSNNISSSPLSSVPSNSGPGALNTSLSRIQGASLHPSIDPTTLESRSSPVVLRTTDGPTVGAYFNSVEAPKMSVLAAQLVNFQHFLNFFLIGNGVFTPSKDKSLAFFTLLQSTVIHMAYSFTTSFNKNGTVVSCGNNDGNGVDYTEKGQNGKNCSKPSVLGGFASLPTPPSPSNSIQNTYSHVLSSICVDEHDVAGIVGVEQGDKSPLAQIKINFEKEKIYCQSLSFTHNITPSAYITTPRHLAHPAVNTGDDVNAEDTNRSLWAQIYHGIVQRYFNPLYINKGDKKIEKMEGEKNLEKMLFSSDQNQNFHNYVSKHRYTTSGKYIDPCFASWSLLNDVLVGNEQRVEDGNNNNNKDDEDEDATMTDEKSEKKEKKDKKDKKDKKSDKPSNKSLLAISPSPNTVLTINSSVSLALSPDEVVRWDFQRYLCVNLISDVLPVLFLSILHISADVATNTLPLLILLPSYLNQVALQARHKVVGDVELLGETNDYKMEIFDDFDNFDKNEKMENYFSKIDKKNILNNTDLLFPKQSSLDHYSSTLSRAYCQFRQPQTLYRSYFSTSSLLLIPQSIGIVASSGKNYSNFSSNQNQNNENFILSQNFIPTHAINTFPLSLPSGEDFPDTLALTTGILSQCTGALATLANYQQVQLFMGLEQLVQGRKDFENLENGKSDKNDKNDKNSKNKKTQNDDIDSQSSIIDSKYALLWNSPEFSQGTELPRGFPLIEGDFGNENDQESAKMITNGQNNETSAENTPFFELNLTSLSPSLLSSTLSCLAPHFDSNAFPRCSLLRTISVTLTQLAQQSTITHLDNSTFLSLLSQHQNLLYKTTIIENIRTYLVDTVHGALVQAAAALATSGGKIDKESKKMAKRSRQEEDDEGKDKKSEKHEKKTQSTILINKNPFAMLLIGAINNSDINPAFQYIFNQAQVVTDPQTTQKSEDLSTFDQNSCKNDFFIFSGSKITPSPPQPVIFTAPALISLCSAIYHFILRAQQPTMVPTHYVFPPDILATILPKPAFPLEKIQKMVQSAQNGPKTSKKSEKSEKSDKTDKIPLLPTDLAAFNSYLSSLTRSQLDWILPGLMEKVMKELRREVVGKKVIGETILSSLDTLSSLFNLRLSTPSFCEVQSRAYLTYFVDEVVVKPNQSGIKDGENITKKNDKKNNITDEKKQNLISTTQLLHQLASPTLQDEKFCQYLSSPSNAAQYSSECGHLTLATVYLEQISALIQLLIDTTNGDFFAHEEKNNQKNTSPLGEKNNNNNNSLDAKNTPIKQQLVDIIGHLLTTGSPMLTTFYQAATTCPCSMNKAAFDAILQKPFTQIKLILTNLITNPNNIFSVPAQIEAGDSLGDDDQGEEGNDMATVGYKGERLRLDPVLKHFLFTSLPLFEWSSILLPEISTTIISRSVSNQVVAMRGLLDKKNNDEDVGKKAKSKNNDDDDDGKKTKKSKKLTIPDPSQEEMVQLVPNPSQNFNDTIVFDHKKTPVLLRFFEKMEIFSLLLTNQLQNPSQQNPMTLFSSFNQLFSLYSSAKVELEEGGEIEGESRDAFENYPIVNGSFENFLSFFSSSQPFLFLHFFRTDNQYFSIYLAYTMYMIVDIYAVGTAGCQKVKDMSKKLNIFVKNLITNPLPATPTTSSSQQAFKCFAETFHHFLLFAIGLGAQGDGDKKEKKSKKDKGDAEKSIQSISSSKADKNDTLSMISNNDVSSFAQLLITQSPIDLFAQMVQFTLPTTSVADSVGIYQGDHGNKDKKDKKEKKSSKKDSSENQKNQKNITSQIKIQFTSTTNLLPPIITNLINTPTPKSAQLLATFVQTLIAFEAGLKPSKKKANKNNTNGKSDDKNEKIIQVIDVLFPQIINALSHLATTTSSQLHPLLLEPDSTLSDTIAMYTYYIKALIQLYQSFGPPQKSLGVPSDFEQDGNFSNSKESLLKEKIAQNLSNPLLFELISYTLLTRQNYLLIDLIEVSTQISCLYKVDAAGMGEFIGLKMDKEEKNNLVIEKLSKKNHFHLVITPLLDNIPSASDSPSDPLSYLPIPIRFGCFLLYLKHAVLQQECRNAQNYQNYGPNGGENLQFSPKKLSPLLAKIESCATLAFTHAISTPQPIQVPGVEPANNALIGVVGNNVVAQQLLDLSMNLFSNNTPPQQLFTKLVAIARFTAAIPSNHNLYSTAMFLQFNPSGCCYEGADSLIRSFTVFSSSLITKSLFSILRSSSPSLFPTLLTLAHLQSGLDSSGREDEGMTDDSDSDDRMTDESDDENPLSHILKLNQQNLHSQSTTPLKFNDAIKTYTKGFATIYRHLDDKKFFQVMKSATNPFLSHSSRHLSLLLAMLPSPSSTAAPNNTDHSELGIFAMQNSLNAVLETVALIVKPASNSTSALPFPTLTALFNLLILFNPLFNESYTDLPAVAVARGEQQAMEDQGKNTLYPYQTTNCIITLGVLLSIFPSYCSILNYLPFHITSLANNNNNVDHLEALSQQNSTIYATQLLSPALTFVFGISNYLHNSMNDYIEQLTRIYTMNHPILINTQRCNNIHLEKLGSSIHHLTKVLINTTYQSNKRMIPYMIITLFNTYLTQYSHYSSQSVISSTQSISFALSIALATITVPKSTGSLYTIKQRETETLTDVDLAVTDLDVLGQYLDTVGKAALAQMVKVASRYRYYR